MHPAYISYVDTHLPMFMTLVKAFITTAMALNMAAAALWWATIACNRLQLQVVGLQVLASYTCG